MEITNIYDFLHLLSLIKIRYNMDFEGDLAYATIQKKIPFFSLKVWGKKHTVPSIHFFSFSLFKLRFN
jgi:hypothetical protein